MDKEKLGQAIRIARASNGLSQEAIAHKLGISRVCVSYAESGRFDQISEETLRQIKLASGFTPEIEDLLETICDLSPFDLYRLLQLIRQEKDAYEATTTERGNLNEEASDWQCAVVADCAQDCSVGPRNGTSTKK